MSRAGEVCRLAAASVAMRAASQARSCGSSQVACAGLSVNHQKATTPNTTEGTPSRMNSQRQPASPANPSIDSSAAESGPPIMSEIGLPTRYVVMARPRSASGNQRIK